MSSIDITALQKTVETEIVEASSLEQIDQLRIKYLGRKGILAQLTGSIPALPKEERAAFGQKINALKNLLTSGLAEKQNSLGGISKDAAPDDVDLTMPGIAQQLGRLHPITQVIDEVSTIFTRMGFMVAQGPEIESEFNNFTGLNIPLDHPSRDAFDTFYLKDTQNLLLRSHTSPVQVRAMRTRQPPFAIVVPGRVYRPDATDASHLFMFHQVEGFMVDTDITFADLKGILEIFVKGVFGKDIKMRLRPHFFPFTEPSAEVDISCNMCQGKGCSSCGRKGWLEILGSGMIHPNVFKHVGIDARKFSGFAFGMGIERIAMLKYGISDIRMFCENDLRFLNQF